MIIYKGFRFRAYPTSEQLLQINAWGHGLRFLWNIANEQRLIGLSRPRDERVFSTAFDQMRNTTELRAEVSWLRDIPRNACNQLLIELDKAWQRCYKQISHTPKWKRKSDRIGITEPDSKHWHLYSDFGRNTILRFPKLGHLRVVAHRPLEGMPKACTIQRDGDQWFVGIVCAVEMPDPIVRTGSPIAIDRGIVNFIAGSDGSIVVAPRYLDRHLVRLAHANRQVSRRMKGSKNKEKAKTRVMRIHRKIRRQREHFLHVESTRLAKNHSVVVIERLDIASMLRGYCARGIVDAGWSRFAEMLRYKLAWSGGTLIEVPAAYSSQTCSVCGAVDAASRNRESFCCTSCGYTDHADLNAAKVILSRAGESPVTVCGGVAALGRPKKQKLYAVRRPTRPIDSTESSG